ncbi:bifunctional DNA primase/polymerase [Frankia sp. Cas3]|uniref:bifunctional DNA primase/polymerase n=1 Tax=Frankia sp. Cas3 TaxID=3073926 RepID=UPI002AD31EA1|nr:bifunctional DNA primase/polymerase [Frankia sp. Cas3]
MAQLVATAHNLRGRLLCAALGYAARGIAVHPVHVGAKRPPLWADWENRATTDPDLIRRVWSQAPYNIGVATGPSGLVAVDLDVPKPGEVTPGRWRDTGVQNGRDVLAALANAAGEPWPSTMTTHTPSGGRHLLYRAPNSEIKIRNSARTVAWCVDIRAHGGYVVGIGSEISGQNYLLDHSAPPTPCNLPPWLLTLISQSEEQPTRGAVFGGENRAAARVRQVAADRGRLERWAAAALLGEASDIAAMPPDSGRNHALNGAAYKMGRLAAGGLLAEDDVRQVLREAALAAGLTGADADRTIKSGMTAGMRRPRAGGAA